MEDKEFSLIGEVDPEPFLDKKARVKAEDQASEAVRQEQLADQQFQKAMKRGENLDPKELAEEMLKTEQNEKKLREQIDHRLEPLYLQMRDIAQNPSPGMVIRPVKVTEDNKVTIQKPLAGQGRIARWASYWRKNESVTESVEWTETSDDNGTIKLTRIIYRNNRQGDSEEVVKDPILLTQQIIPSTHAERYFKDEIYKEDAAGKEEDPISGKDLILEINNHKIENIQMGKIAPRLVGTPLSGVINKLIIDKDFSLSPEDAANMQSQRFHGVSIRLGSAIEMTNYISGQAHRSGLPRSFDGSKPQASGIVYVPKVAELHGSGLTIPQDEFVNIVGSVYSLFKKAA